MFVRAVGACEYDPGVLPARARRQPGGRVAARVALSLAAALTVLTASAGPALAKSSINPTVDRALIEEYARLEGAKLHVALPGGSARFIELKESSSHTISTPIGPALGTTLCRDAGGGAAGPAAACEVELAVLPHTNGELRDTVAHEVFHAYQAVMAGTLENFNRPENDWLIEGSAEWAESQLIAKDRSARHEWARYLRSPGTQLFARTYSAVGFFGHMASSGISPWGRLAQMFAATSAAASWEAGIAGNTKYLDSEASAFFREPALGAAWDQSGANVPSRGEAHYVPPTETVTASGTPKPLAAKPYADGPYDLVLSHLSRFEPLVELHVESGYVRVHSITPSSSDRIVTGKLVLCGAESAKECQCPKEPVSYQRFLRGDVAITGASTGGEVLITRRKPCDVLLPLVKCENLLPGFSTQVSEGLGNVVGRPSLGATATSPEGSTASNCAFLEKGIVDVEGTFHGVIAPFVGVLRASTDAGAARYYEIITKVIPGGFVVSHPLFGEEALLATTVVSGPLGAEFGSYAIVREHNIVVDYALFSTPGNDEADPGNSLTLLRRVAATL
jgi:hypothetical protein